MNQSHKLSTPIGSAIALVVAAALLAGCSPSDKAEAATTAPAAAAAQTASSTQQSQAPVAIARGKIEVEGGLIELAPSVDGLVQELAVKDGQSVQREQVLLRLADDISRADLSVAESEWQLAQAREKATAARVEPLKAMLTRWQTAAQEGAADAHSVDEATQQLRDAEAQVSLAKAEAKVAQARMEQLRALQKRLELRAPEAGTVVHVATHAGSQVGPGQPVVTLLPNKPLIVRAELNESYVSAVREGMRATVVIDGDAASMAATALPEAKVLRISPVYGPANLQDDTQRGPVRIVESVLAFDQPPANARVGQNVRVTFYE